MSRLVCHLIDSNVDTSYFRSIVRHHDRKRSCVMIGSLGPEGALQRAVRDLGAPTFAIGAVSRWQYCRAIPHLARRLRRERVAILHAHCFDPTFVGLIAARVAGVSFVFTRHHSDHHLRLGKRWHTRIDAWCGRRADRVIAVSHATKRIMTSIENVPERKVVVVHIGMEAPEEPMLGAAEEVRQKLGLTGKAVCLMIARLHEEKGHLVLFDALSKIVAHVPSLVVLLVGMGPHREWFEAEVRQRALQRVVTFLGHRNDVPTLITLSSIIVLPSLAESFGFAALEAMSLGRPVIASDTGGLPEVVAHGETGLVVPTGDVDALGTAMCKLLEDPRWCSALGQAGRRRAALFSSERMMQGYEEVYDGLDA